jgi:hypothetical protein
VLIRTCGSDVSFAAVHLLPKGGGDLVFAAELGNPLQVLHEAALGQREACWLRPSLSEREKARHSRIQQTERLANRLDASLPSKVPE